MIQIRLFCVAGILSNVIVNKMRDAAKLRELEVDIQSFSESHMVKKLEEADVVLLGPQIAYKLPKIKLNCESMGIAIDLIPMKDLGMMNANNILNIALKSIEEEKERQKRVAIEKENAEREAAEQEAIEKENAERKVAEQEAIEKENAERKVVEQEAIEKENAEREAEEQEAIKKENAEREAAEQKTIEKENVQRKVAEQKAIERKREEEEIAQRDSEEIEEKTIHHEISKVDDKDYKIDDILNVKGYDNMIKKVKELILSAEKEIYISSNIDIEVFKDEILEISQRGVRLTVVSFKEYDGEELPIDTLYTYVDEKNKNKDSIIMIVVDSNKALVADNNINKEEISHVITDNKLLVSTISKNIHNNIYLLKLRDNIAFKLKDI